MADFPSSTATFNDLQILQIFWDNDSINSDLLLTVHKEAWSSEKDIQNRSVTSHLKVP